MPYRAKNKKRYSEKDIKKIEDIILLLKKRNNKKISDAKKGHKVSEKTKRKIRKTLKGRRCSPRTEFKKKDVRVTGKNAWNWQGGKSFKPYGVEFNEHLKEVVRNRDRRKCFICEKTELENKEKLSVHHIDYCKKNNNLNNLISLCRECHLKTNYNRKKWMNYFNKNEISNN